MSLSVDFMKNISSFLEGLKNTIAVGEATEASKKLASEKSPEKVLSIFRDLEQSLRKYEGNFPVISSHLAVMLNDEEKRIEQASKSLRCRSKPWETTETEFKDSPGPKRLKGCQQKKPDRSKSDEGASTQKQPSKQSSPLSLIYDSKESVRQVLEAIRADNLVAVGDYLSLVEGKYVPTTKEEYLEVAEVVAKRLTENTQPIQRLDCFGPDMTRLPLEVTMLKTLTHLSFLETRLTTLPKEIGNLTGLTELRLANNQLTTLPKEIEELRGLTVSGKENQRPYRSVQTPEAKAPETPKITPPAGKEGDAPGSCVIL
jgi:hypothetical protein